MTYIWQKQEMWTYRIFPTWENLSLIAVVQSLSYPTLWTAACQASLSSPFPGVCSNSCPLSQWCHPTISSLSPPALNLSQHQGRSFLMSRLLPSGGQNIEDSAAVPPVNIQGWFLLGLTGLNSLLSKGLSRVFSSTSLKASILLHLAFFMVQVSHPYVTIGKTIALTIWTFVGKVRSLLFNILSTFVIAYLPKSKCLLILWLQ